MRRILLDEQKPFYKANLHCHSTASDGALTPEEVKRAFCEQGYSVVAFTDHEHIVDQSHLTDENFLALTGCELGVREFQHKRIHEVPGMRVCHLNLIAREPHNDITPCYCSYMDSFIKPEFQDRIHFLEDCEREYSAAGINRIIRRAKEAGFLVTYNHPGWSLENAVQYLQYENLDFAEIYNHAGVAAGYPDYQPCMIDDFWRKGENVFAVMCDDCHFPGGEPRDAFGGWVQINAPRLTYADVIAALEHGDFYASNGPSVRSLIVEDDVVRVTTGPCREIAYCAGARHAEAVRGTDLTSASFRIRPTDGYFRLSITDAQGHCAHTQPCPVEATP